MRSTPSLPPKGETNASRSSRSEESPPLEGAGGGIRKTQIFNFIPNAKIIKKLIFYHHLKILQCEHHIISIKKINITTSFF